MAQATSSSRNITIPAHLRASKIIAYIMYVWVFIGIVALGLRLFLLAFSASVTAPFVEFVYRTSAQYLEPFRGIFPPRQLGETGYFDVAALFAIIMYLLLAWGFSALITYVQSRIDKEAALQQEELALAAANKRVRRSASTPRS
jgi:uncharacterized protein YggT (Ycf19 family)